MTAPTTSPRPVPRDAEGFGLRDITEFAHGLVWQAEELLWHARQSDWLPYLAISVGGLLALWITGWLKRRFRSGGRGVVTRRGLPCKWRNDKVRRTSGLRRWQCTVCGVDAFTSDGKPPKECKRGLREAQL